MGQTRCNRVYSFYMSCLYVDGNVYLFPYSMQKTTNTLCTIDLPPWRNVSFARICYETALDRKTYTIMLVSPKDDKRAIYHWSTSMHFRIRKTETSPFSLFAMKRHWTEKHCQYACKANRRQTRYIPLIYFRAFRRTKKEKALVRETYTVLLVRPKNDKGAKYHWSNSMPFE